MFFSNKGVLGINARNLLYIRPYNPKKAIKFADDKLKTKNFLAARDIPVPKLYGIIKDYKELEKFDFKSIGNSFALKPNRGFGGEGIIPVLNKINGKYLTAGGKEYSEEELRDHIQDILDGRFSIGNVADVAFFEQLIVADERLGKYSYEGLPDIRIVVHNLIPVMAMLRLPTKESEGKANLHMGAVGIGIDIAKGETTHLVHKNKIVQELPDNLGSVQGLKIPYWDDMLLIASKVQLLSNLGYMAIDLCLDKNSGSVLLEINARAGLSVQIANLAPLRKRLERIEGIKVSTPTQGVRIAKDMFGNIVEKEIKNISGKQVIGTQEAVEIIQKNGTFRILAKIDTGKQISVINEETALKNGLLEDTENYDDEKSTLKLKFSLKKQRIQTVIDVEKMPEKDYKMIIGSRDLKNFLIDTSQKGVIKIEKEKKQSEKSQIDFHKIDEELAIIDEKIKLLYHLRPLNLESEKQKFFNNNNYNPQFEYPALKFDPDELLNSLRNIQTDNSSLGKIFENKKEEIINKIELIKAIDSETFTQQSIKLFDQPTKNEKEKCEKFLAQTDQEKQNEKFYDSQGAKDFFEKAFEKYGLNDWNVKIKPNMVSDCVAGKNNKLFVKEGAKFTQDGLETLVIHEIETHILTAENGKIQPYEILNRGLANYLITQEGLAMYNVEIQKNRPFIENRKAITHVIAIYESLNHSFSEVYKKLIQLNIPEDQAFRSCLKAKRGFKDTSQKGTFTKDYIYYKGYLQVKNFMENGGNLKELYRGKFNLDDLETVKNIPEILLAQILPTWLK